MQWVTYNLQKCYKWPPQTPTGEKGKSRPKHPNTHKALVLAESDWKSPGGVGSGGGVTGEKSGKDSGAGMGCGGRGRGRPGGPMGKLYLLRVGCHLK